jgi:predicted nucleic acid-binding protein
VKASVPRAYFDTSVFVAVLLGPEAESHEAALTAVAAAQQGRMTGVVSALVVAEVVGAPAIRAPQGVPRETWRLASSTSSAASCACTAR